VEADSRQTDNMYTRWIHALCSLLLCAVQFQVFENEIELQCMHSAWWTGIQPC
jgi:hypothetical protein